jgi:hypothetical protein
MADYTDSKVTFMSVGEFKEQIGASSIEVLRNPKTDKLFLSAGGATYRCQQDIDKNADMRMLIPEEGINDACLVNVSGGAETQFSL